MSSWNRVYRPRRVSELHLDTVRAQLQELMESGTFPQVLLFAGPKGTGKTSTSRIIGALLNDPRNVPGKPFAEPDIEAGSFLNKIFDGTSFVVQEMDAASNRGIDDVRALREKVMLPPQEGRMAVYILDEAHMLTTEAFNALLKLLEEPPSHATFILATTELHKIPPTIVSRAHVIHFRKASQLELVTALERVLKAEGVTYEPDAISLIAQSADGSFRDAIKVAQVVAQSGDVVLERVSQFRVSSLQAEIQEIVAALTTKNPGSLMQLFEELRARAIDEHFFYKRLIEFLHTTLLQELKLAEGAPAISSSVAQFLLKELCQPSVMSPSPVPFLTLELKMLEIIERAKKKTTEPPTNPPPASPPPAAGSRSASRKTMVAAAAPDQTVDLDSPNTAEHSADRSAVKDTVHATSEVLGDGALLCQQWPRFIALVSEKNVTLGALLRSAKPVRGQHGLAEISVFYSFHQEQLASTKVLAIFEDCIRMITGGTVKLVFTLDAPPAIAELVSTSESEQLSTVVSQVLM